MFLIFMLKIQENYIVHAEIAKVDTKIKEKLNLTMLPQKMLKL
jgi:hypothetical protein